MAVATVTAEYDCSYMMQGHITKNLTSKAKGAKNEL
jgi:hypothetical protein